MININARSIFNKTVNLEHSLIGHDPSVVVTTKTCVKPGILDDEVVALAYRLVRGGG